MLFLFADAAVSAPKSVQKKVIAQPKQNEAMGTLLELNQEEVLATYKGGVVKRKEVVTQLANTGMNLKNPQPLNALRDIEKRLALTLAVQKYINTLSTDKSLSESERSTLEFIKGQFIAKSYLSKRTVKNISDADVKKMYEKLRLKAQKEVLYKLSMCVLSSKEKATQIVNSLKSKAKAEQRASFVRYVKSDSIFEANKKDDGALPPFTKEKLAQFLSPDLAKVLVQYAKNSLIPQVFEIKGSYFVFFLDDVQKMADTMPAVSQMTPEEIKQMRPLLEAQIASENRLPQLRQIATEGGVKVNGLAQISDEYLQTAVMP